MKNLSAVGSSNKSENNIGYFTKYGDGAANVWSIVSLYKTQVREWARHLGINEKIIAKKSSPHLWPNHEAEHEIGVNYEQIDIILYCLIDKKLSLEDTVKESQIDKEIVEKIHDMYKNSEHKRINPKELWMKIIFIQIR